MSALTKSLYKYSPFDANPPFFKSIPLKLDFSRLSKLNCTGVLGKDSELTCLLIYVPKAEFSVKSYVWTISEFFNKSCMLSKLLLSSKSKEPTGLLTLKITNFLGISLSNQIGARILKSSACSFE